MDEANREIKVQLFEEPPPARYFLVGGTQTAQVTVEDNDLPEITISAPARVTEGWSCGLHTDGEHGAIHKLQPIGVGQVQRNQ